MFFLYDSDYNLVVTYKYDAWGKVISITDTTINNIGTLNPFRYRSYYYDEEIKLYYLNSRYYNPEWGRFINADGFLKISTLGSNLFIYTENNLINNIDVTGKFFKSFIENAKTSLKSIKKVKADKEKKENAKKYKSYFTYELGSGTGVAASSGVVGVTDTTDVISRCKRGKLSETAESQKGFTIGH